MLHATPSRSALPLHRALFALAATLSAPALLAQMHKVEKPQTVVRAVGVYEWTGDMAKPTAMRLVPVSLFIDGHLEDAGVYLARPIPFALDTGVVYEVQQAGVPKGQVDLRFARHFETASTSSSPFDDGWFGYGRFVPPAPPKKSTLRPSANLAKINGLDDEDDDRPHFSRRSAAPGSGAAAAGIPAPNSSPASDPDRPTLHRGSSGGTQTADTTAPAGSEPPPDPDRPTLHRGSSGSDSDADIQDPDRPTLRRRTKADAAAATASDGIADVPSLNNDPNRPILHRGKPTGEPSEADFPKLSGLPAELDLHQMVAVSDAANRPVHDFARAWEDDSGRAAILSKMEAFAQAQLTAYEIANAEKPAATPPPPTTHHHPNSKLRHGVTPDTKPAAPTPEKLEDEQLKAYTLTYGGPAVYVYTAHTDGLGPTLLYVTLVAEVDMRGDPQLALHSVTDAAHLDRTPRMRLIDAVDPDDSNRGNLLFELRETNARQFGLYRVLGGQATQTFLTGTTQ